MMARKMPAHIVLPNGMWRFVKGRHKEKSIGLTRLAKKYKSRRSRSVARRRGRSKGGSMVNKLLSKKNLMYTIGGILLGAAVLKVDPKVAGAVGGFLGAGPVGAVAGYIAAPTIAGLGGPLLSGITSGAPLGAYTY